MEAVTTEACAFLPLRASDRERRTFFFIDGSGLFANLDAIICLLSLWLISIYRLITWLPDKRPETRHEQTGTAIGRVTSNRCPPSGTVFYTAWDTLRTQNSNRLEFIYLASKTSMIPGAARNCLTHLWTKVCYNWRNSGYELL